MPSRVKEKTRIRESRGTGIGSEYKPWIKTRELQGSLSVRCNPKNWKNGRTMELLSLGEEKFWYLINWNDDVVDTQEQFPLDIKITRNLCSDEQVVHPYIDDEFIHMTTDLLVTYKDGHQEAFSIKSSKKCIEPKKENEGLRKRLRVEKRYWEEQNIKFHIIFTEDIDKQYLNRYYNIRTVIPFYDINEVFDKCSMLKHLIATKTIEIDMDKELLNFRKLMKEYGGLIEWKN